jgi:hypothetical protein
MRNWKGGEIGRVGFDILVHGTIFDHAGLNRGRYPITKRSRNVAVRRLRRQTKRESN